MPYNYVVVILINTNYVFCFLPISESSQCDEAGKFGWKCRFTCNCMNDSYCDKKTGHCSDGCTPGYYGAGCQFGMYTGNTVGLITGNRKVSKCSLVG